MNPTVEVNAKKPSSKKVTQSHNIKEQMSIDAKKKLPSKYASQKPFIIKETMAVDPDMMSFVAGRKGRNVKRLEEIYGVAISLSPRGDSQIILQGSFEKVSAAKKGIEANLSNKTSFVIKKDHICLVIGRNGEKIRALEDALIVKIDINKEDGEVVVTGTRCEEAKKAIEEILSFKMSFFIEKGDRWLFIRQGGENIRALRKAYNVTIDIEEDGEVVMMGKEGEAAKKAIESLIDNWKAAAAYEERFSVSAQLIGHLIGKDGLNRKRIETTYNVFMLSGDEGEPEIVLRGFSAEEVTAAKKDILDSLGEVLDLDESFVGGIIGHGGEMVGRIEKECGVAIHFEPKNQGVKGRRRVYILGEKDRTKAAKNDIISIITGRKRAC